MQYDLPLAEEKVKPHQLTTLHLVSALAFIVTGAIIVVYNYTIPLWGGAILAAGLLLLIITIFRNKWIISNKINPVFRIIELLMAITIGSYSYALHWKFPAFIFTVLSAAVAFALFWERAGAGELAVHIDESGLRLPVTSRKRFISWVDVDQVVLRYGTLTIDCTNNQLFQWTIPDTHIDPEIFDAFCIAQVEANRHKRRTDEWKGF